MLTADHTPATTDALLALGRLDGALAMARPATLRLFVMHLMRIMLMTALRQEGHTFTDHRFNAWFAGVAILSDEPAHPARPPKTLCEAILTELTHSKWDLLAQTAMRFEAALLAPSDHIGSNLSGDTAHKDAGAIITAARDLIQGLVPSPDPLVALAQLHHAAAAHVLFAPPERAAEPISLGAIQLTVERMPMPSPRWALELLWGEHWRNTGHVVQALPFPDLIRLDALRAEMTWDSDAFESTPTILARTLCDCAQGLSSCLTAVDRLARRLADCQVGQRRSSRAPALLEVLTGFGPMRSAQLETLLGVTRLGLRTMLGALDAAGLLIRTTLAGVHLYAVNLEIRATDDGDDLAALPPFSSATLDEYDAAMTQIDALLARSSVNLDASDAANDPRAPQCQME